MANSAQANPPEKKPSQRMLGAFLAIFAIAFAVRLIYLWDVGGNPLYNFPVGDGREYYDWAGRIADGAWVGEGVFYQAPLYPYFLAVIRAAGFHGFTGIFVVQSFLGAIGCGCVFLAGAKFFSRRVGEIAGFLVAFYAPSIFYDGVLQKATLDFFFMSVLLALLALSLDAPAVWKWIVIGALLGFLSLTRENALILVPAVAVWLVVYFRDRAWRRRLPWLGALAAGLVVILMPVAIRNLAVGGDFALTTSQMGPNFYIGNNPNSTGTYVALLPARGDPIYEKQDATELAEHATGRTLTPSEVSRFWMGRALDYIRREPFQWLGLMLRKTAIFWQSFEVPDQEDCYIYQMYSPVLRILGYVFQFGLICPLAVLGIILTWRGRRRLWVLYALTLIFAASVIAFYIFARYRLAIVPILAIFAAACIAEIVAAVKRRRRNVVLASVAGVIALAILVNLPSPLGSPSTPNRYNLAIAMMVRNPPDLDGAERNLRIQVKETPNWPHLEVRLANVLVMKASVPGVKAGDARALLQDAIEHYATASNLMPDWTAPVSNMGKACVLLGDFQRAEDCFRRVLRLDPNDDEIRQALQDCIQRAARGGVRK